MFNHVVTFKRVLYINARMDMHGMTWYFKNQKSLAHPEVPP